MFEYVKWVLTYMKWPYELPIYINNSPQTFDIHTISVAVAIVPFQKAGKADGIVCSKACLHRNIPSFVGFCNNFVCR